MINYISTYFYQDTKDLGATYGNIFLPLEERNIIYWQTVYTFFFTAIVFNKKNEFKYALFTNEKKFPFRHEIEKMGVEIHDNLSLTNRNIGKWATVNFFFDVINYITNSTDFSKDDAFLLLDTDVIAMNEASDLFDFIRSNRNPVVKIIGKKYKNKKNYFHGVTTEVLEQEASAVLSNKIEILEFVGGEFFGFVKSNVSNYKEKYLKLLLNKNMIFTTEEQILTILNTLDKFNSHPLSIYRIWNTLKKIDVPMNYNEYIFLHLPSDKELGLDKLFKYTITLSPADINILNFRKKILKLIPFDNTLKLYFNVIKSKLF
jgi:hypothetical protein